MAAALRPSLARFPAAALAALCALAGSVARAQDQPASPPPDAAKDVADMDLEELARVRVSPFEVSAGLDSGYRASNSVSASRFDSPILDLPFAIQAFTGTFVQDQEPENLFDVARYSPGVTYRSNDFNEGNANLAIRGFAASSVPGDPQVLRDGFHGPSILDFTNVSRIEVVKGPASFLYGQLAPGGVVNVITKSPRRTFAATAEVRTGSYGQRRFDVDVTGPAARSLLYRVAASFASDMQYWDPYEAHQWDLAPSILWQPLDGVSVSLKLERFRKEETPQVMQKPGYNTQAGVVPTPSDPNLSGVDVPGLPDDWNSMSFADYRRSDTTGITTWIDLRLGEHWNLRAAFAHQDYEIDMAFSGNLGMANNQTLLQGRRFRRQTYTNRDDTLELQAVGRYAVLPQLSLRLLLGAQYVDRRFHATAGQAPNDPALGNDPIGSPLPLWNLADPSTWNRVVNIPLSSLTENPTDQTTRWRDRSAHAGVTLGLLDDRVLALAGWRATWTESHLLDRVTGAPWFDQSAASLTPQYGLLWKVAAGVSVFASYAESFVPAARNLTNPDGTFTPARPTRGRGADAGVKADLLGGRLSGTVSLFEIRNRNIINDLSVTDARGNVTIYNVQSGEQRSRGLEVDVTATPRENWQLYFSYSYIDARIVEFSGQDHAILAQDPAALDTAGQRNYKNVLRFHGAPLQMSAPHLANLRTRYDVRDGVLQGLYLAGGVSHVRDQTLLPDSPTWARQTYTLVDGTVGYTWTCNGLRPRVAFMGKNLAGAAYRPSQSTRARPREFLFTLAVDR